MVIINPWTYYQVHDPDKIPDLNPHNDDEIVGCLFGVCSFIIASILFILITYLLFSVLVSYHINRHWLPLLMLVNCVVVYPILTILLMKLSFKIADKINK